MTHPIFFHADASFRDARRRSVAVAPDQHGRSRAAIWAVCLVVAIGSVGRLSAQLPFRSSLTIESNEVVLSWDSVPGGKYQALTSTNLDGPWVPLQAAAVEPLNRAEVRGSGGATNRFFQVAQEDLEFPELWGLLPPDHGIAVTRRGTIEVTFYDDGVIDTNSIRFSITNGPPMSLANSRLSFTGGVLAFQQEPNEVLGEFGQTIPVSVSVADASGNRLEHTWSFQLEETPMVAANVLVVTNESSRLVLLATNAAGDTFTFGFAGDTSGLTPGQIIVGSDPTLPYRRRIASVDENAVNHIAIVVTTAASLADCLDQGSVQFEDGFTGATVEPPGGGFAAAAAAPCCLLNFDNQSMMATPNIDARVTRGRLDARVKVGVRASLGAEGLEGVDLDWRAALALDLTFEATAHAAGAYTNRVPLGSTTRLLPIDFAGPVPSWVEAKLEFVLGFESAWQQPGTIRAGVNSTNLFSIASQMRSGLWSNFTSRISRYHLPPPTWQTNLNAGARVYVDVILSLKLDGVPGPSLTAQPSLELAGAAYTPSGFAGFDLAVHDGFASALSLDVRGWDSGLAPTNFVPLLARDLIYRHQETVRIGPGLRPIANMAWVPPGRFALGRAASPLVGQVCDCPLTQVTLTEGFFIGRFEITQGEFLQRMGVNPSFHHGGVWQTNLNRPVENLSWHEASNYCARLTAQERDAERIPYNYAYRLPTEAEWEYAARAGTITRYHYGDNLRSGYANFDCHLLLVDPCATNPVLSVVAPSISTNAQPVSVGRFAPNGWGLRDVHGNVSEWCLDWLGEVLPGGELNDPRGAPDALVRAFRGGAYLDNDQACQASFRTPLAPDQVRPWLGFRIVLASTPLVSEVYTNVMLPGFNLIANQLDQGSNRIQDVLPFAPDEASVKKFNALTQNYDEEALRFEGQWFDSANLEPSTMTLSPGEGAFFYLPSASPLNLTFSGLRRLVVTPPTLVPGFQLISRQVPEPGNFQNIVGRPPVDGVAVLRFHAESGNYSSNYFNNGTWTLGPPTARRGEAWFLKTP